MYVRDIGLREARNMLCIHANEYGLYTFYQTLAELLGKLAQGMFRFAFYNSGSVVFLQMPTVDVIEHELHNQRCFHGGTRNQKTPP